MALIHAFFQTIGMVIKNGFRNYFVFEARLIVNRPYISIYFDQPKKENNIFLSIKVNKRGL